MNELLSPKDMQAFLDKRDDTKIAGIGTEAVSESHPMWVQLKPGSKIRVPRGEGTTMEREVGAFGLADPQRVGLRIRVAVTRTQPDLLSKLLDQIETSFIDLMNGRDKGFLYLFSYSGWTFRYGAGHYDFWRVVSAIKELK